MQAVKEAVKVYKIALLAGHDQRTAIVAARRATDRLAKYEETSVGGIDFWKGVRTPGQIRDEINRIDGEVKSTGSDLASLEAAHLHSPDGHDITDFMDAVWDPFIASWTKFWAEHQSWGSNFWGATWDTAEDFQRQLVAIRENARKLGLALRSADPVTPKESGWEAIAKAVWALVKVVIIGLLIIGGIFMIGKVL